MKKRSTIIIEEFIICSLLFIIFALLRWIPEYNMGSYPIGNDTVVSYPYYYIEKIGLIKAIFSSNLFHWLVSWSNSLSKIDMWLSIKFWGCLLYGSLATSFYVYSRKGLKMNRFGALFVTMIFIFSLSTLRMSRELFRNFLGLIFFFYFATFINQISRYNKFVINIFYTIISIILFFFIFASHQLVTIFTIIFLVSLVLSYLISGNFPKQFLGAFIIGSIIIFIPTIFNRYILGVDVWRSYLISDVYTPNPNGVNSYFIISFISFLYSTLFPFLLFGILKKYRSYNLILLFFLFIIVISPIIYQGNGFYLWDRWSYFLIIPMSYFVYYGIEWVSKNKYLNLLIPKEFILLVSFLIIFWKPVAFIVSGDNKIIPNINLPDQVMNQYFPQKMSENGLGLFNNKEYQNFFIWFNNKNKDNDLTILDFSLATFARIKGIKSPILETYYRRLSQDTMNQIVLNNKYFYSINENYGYHANEILRFNNLIIYKFASMDIIKQMEEAKKLTNDNRN